MPSLVSRKNRISKNVVRDRVDGCIKSSKCTSFLKYCLKMSFQVHQKSSKRIFANSQMFKKIKNKQAKILIAADASVKVLIVMEKNIQFFLTKKIKHSTNLYCTFPKDFVHFNFVMQLQKHTEAVNRFASSFVY